MQKNIIEIGIDEAPHDKPSVVLYGVTEDSISDCDYGCKYYRHARTGSIVLMHNKTYGCKRTKDDIQMEMSDV